MNNLIVAAPAGNEPDKQPITFGAAGKVLACGFDTIWVSLGLVWHNENFFNLLTRLKNDAHAQGVAMPGVMEANGLRWVFNLEPRGAIGFEWLLKSRDFDVKMIRSRTMIQRPSAVVEIRSATLWQKGVIATIQRILALFEAQGAVIAYAKATRADPCLDILIQDTEWTREIEDHAVTRAQVGALYKRRKKFSGIAVGKGKIQARIYDKPYEIKSKSKKHWMYDVWGISEVPAGGRIIRVEFQLMREVMRELGLDSIWSVLDHPQSLWAYCTSKWLKFQDRPDLHHTQQHTLPWWKSVQNEFLGSQKAHPLIRAKIVSANKVQIAQQMIGQLTSLLALDSDGDITPGGRIELEEQLSAVMKSAELIGMDEHRVHERVRRKVAKYAMDTDKFNQAQKDRQAKGLPVLEVRPDQKGGAK